MFTVADVMKSPVISVDTTATVMEAMHLMRQKAVSSVLVTPKVKGGQAGIMTQRDIMSKVVTKGKDPKKLKVRQVMSSPLVTVPPDCSLRDAAKLMVRRNIRRVLVAEGGKIIGIVSDTDIFSAVEERGWEPSFKER
jgi:isocitrate dehydrogenase